LSDPSGSQSPMDLKQLTCFVRVAELGSFTRAAQALDMTQPQLSRHVRALETRLRQPLLRRHGRGAEPTPSGQRLLEHARAILHQIARAEEDMLHQLNAAAGGQVALGLPPSVARVLAVPLMRAFAQAVPEGRLSISEGLSQALVQEVVQGRLDLAVLYAPRPQPSLLLEALANEELMLVGQRPPGLAEDPPPGPITLHALAHTPLVVPRQPNAVRACVESALAAQRLRPHIALEIDGVAATLDLVADGAGCAVLSRHAVLRSPRPWAYTMRRIGSQGLRIALSVARSASHPSSAAQREALRVLQSTAARVLAD
jgi:LysR family nitrogen assimilation transcriptional regulator